MTRQRVRALLVPAALAATLSACGSTVQLADGSGPGVPAPGAPAGDGLSIGPDGAVAPGDGAPAAPGAPGAPGSFAGSAGGAQGGQGGQSGGVAPGTPGGPPQGPSGRPGAPAAFGPGVTATTIAVGVTYTTDGDQANAAIGAAGITQGDEKAYVDAVIADLNSRGGIAGRRVVAVYHGYRAQTSESKATQDQAACARFTQDSKVFAVLGGGLSENLPACLNKAGVLSLASGTLINQDDEFFRRYPASIQLSTPSQNRMMRDYVATLSRLKYFTGWTTSSGQPGAAPVKVGVLSVDNNYWKRPLRSVLLPALQRAGFPVDAQNVAEIHEPQNQADVSQSAAQVQNATLRLQSNGVTHVVMLDQSGILTILFAQNARTQRYFPRLGLNSAAGPQALHDAGVVDNDQLHGAVGLGWFPSIDVPAAAGAKVSPPGTKRCLDVIKKRTGQSFTSSNAATIALTKCDMAWFLAEAVRRAGGSITTPSVLRAVEGMGTSFQGALLPRYGFGPGRRDAVETGFDMRWDTSCECNTYVGSHRIG